MENNESNISNDRDTSKKPKNLPPIENESPKPVHKK